MSVFTKSLTNKGIALQAKAQAGRELRYTRFVIGDGRLSGQLLPTMTNVISQKKTIPVTKLQMRPPNEAIVGFSLSNQDVTAGFYFRELGLFAMDPDEGEILYLYANAGETADYIPPAGSDDVIQKSFDTLAFVGQAQNVTANIDHSLVYVTHPELAEAIAGVKIEVPDASLTKKGITQLSNATNGTRENVAATEKAVKTAYDKGAKAETDAATAQARAATAESNAKAYTDARPWQKSMMTADSGTAINMPAGTDLHTYAFSTGFYMGSGIVNAPNSGWFYFEVLKHNDMFMTINAYNLDNSSHSYRQKKKINGIWGPWSDDLFTSVNDGKGSLETIIIGKGGTVSKAGSVATFPELVNGVNSIQQGVYQNLVINTGGTQYYSVARGFTGVVKTLGTIPAKTRLITMSPIIYAGSTSSWQLSAMNGLNAAICLVDSNGVRWQIGTIAYGNELEVNFYYNILSVDTGNCDGAYYRRENGNLAKVNISKPANFSNNGPMTLAIVCIQNTRTDTADIMFYASSLSVISM
ncbi:tail fiber protein [Paenibacillus sp. Marseille-Q4541]|uniref:tail fiber protein n=1 Tax=Paenibacillus sp. Marseille-Q4541 TaxID=2831522 RepID=UPI002019D2F9|nr:tail fiber protein [Paenibacillus sp. Marseille-Q4541]